MLKFCYNFLGRNYYFTESTQPIPAGRHQVRMEFAYDGGGLGKGGGVSLFFDGQKVGEGRIEMTQPFYYSADETVDVGVKDGSPVSPDYGPRGNAFNGEVNWVELDADKDAIDQDHFLAPEERFHVTLALQ